MGQSRSTSYYGHDLWDRAAPPVIMDMIYGTEPIHLLVQRACVSVCIHMMERNYGFLKNEPNFPLSCPYVSSSATSVCDSAHRVIRLSASYPNNSQSEIR